MVLAPEAVKTPVEIVAKELVKVLAMAIVVTNAAIRNNNSNITFCV